MNSVLNDYSSIKTIELEKRISFYEHMEFHQETVALFIPDVVPYVNKIFECMRWAKEYRQIVEDICSQIVEQRKSSNHLVQSIGYHVGALIVDGRAYAQKNIRHWCQSVVSTNDCLRQILNITFGLGFRPWEFFTSRTICERLKNKHLESILNLYNGYGTLIRRCQEFDNYDKHNLTLRGYEKFDPSIMNQVEYYLKITDIEHAVSDFLTDEFERNIKIALVELLDNIFAMASTAFNKARYYVQFLYDPSDDLDIKQHIASLPISDHIIPAVVKTEEQVDGRIIVKSVVMFPGTNLPKNIYLSELHQEFVDNIHHQSLNKLTTNCIVIKKPDGTMAEYHCVDAKDQTAAYFHFKNFRLNISKPNNC